MEVAMSLAFRVENGESDLHSAVFPGRLSVDADIKGPSKTRQEFMPECDINGIMARAEATGVFPFKEIEPPQFLDFIGMPDLQQAMAHMFDAEAAFMRLPALVRKEFDNDPVRFVEFAQKPDSLEQLRTWGLAEPAKVPDPPLRVEVVSPSIVPAPAAPAKA